jgi:hypothetical protein
MGKDAIMNPSKARVPIGVLLTLGVLPLAAIAYGARSTTYGGRTSQKQPISFTIANGKVNSLKYHINDKCPHAKLLLVHNWGFPPIPVNRSRFAGKFVAKPPQIATAIVEGIMSGRTVSGSLSDRTKDRKTHKFCTGKATFKLTHR